MNKYLITRFLTLAAFIILMCSCNEDFLERYPQDEISDAAYWTSEKDLENYVNGLYDILPSYTGYAPKYAWENGTDNMIGDDRGVTMINGRIWNTNGDAPASSSTWNGAYDNLRKINYFLEQKDKVGEDILANASAAHYVGEALFFRAWVNFDLLKTFGGVPFIDQVLSTDSEELYAVRLPRDEFAQKIIDDLDEAIENLQWSGSGPAAASMRITKEAALGFKTRVALFEGSWEYYHAKMASPFKVDGKDGSDFLNEAISASQMLIDRLGDNIYTTDYRTLFNQDHYYDIPSVLLYREYLPSDGIGHRWWNYNGAGGGGIGLTKSLVDDYLMVDGTPIELSADYQGDATLEAVVASRDPRLGQTIYHPGQGTLGEIIGSSYAGTAPGITSTITYYKCSTGYFCYKGVAPQDAVYNGSPAGQGLIYLRYGEVLLSHAEAKAILGTITQSDLDRTVNVLRDRVGMAHMDMANVTSWGGNYQKRYPDESNLINEIRRERRVELAMEGQRYDDLRRWGALEQLIGWVPRGAKGQQFLDYANSTEGQAVGYSLSASGIYLDEEGYLLPIGHRSDFQDGGTGFVFNANRDYLQAVPRGQIVLYQEKGGVTLTQNPNWN
ncbi:RagB/SusD family nutrient uptake outer membrane protein [Echinicola sp. CAU 1574]|uniref:RagB/SusD family nutrient uptake outer membrane protein n=1 Tax=Echinicola arenosa TaxID=2774144 RepID=A0ABR9AL34_9BACT|nr:RagB/SusD family nutrient uptake outer membrane protein [Echinicola arenosa]MBD8489503.1 RagB/SusD family nutrient uptake outer membrane protein [Echinicola arenosa]